MMHNFLNNLLSFTDREGTGTEVCIFPELPSGTSEVTKWYISLFNQPPKALQFVLSSSYPALLLHMPLRISIVMH